MIRKGKEKTKNKRRKKKSKRNLLVQVKDIKNKRIK